MPARRSLKDRNKAAITRPVEVPTVEPVDEPTVEVPQQSTAAPVAEVPTAGERGAPQSVTPTAVEEPAGITEPGGVARRPQALPAGTARLGLYLRQATLEGAKSAYVADLDALADPPTSFARWIAAALDAHAGRTPADRAKLAQAHPDPEEGKRGVNRAFILPVDTIATMEETTGIDRRAGRMQSVSQLAAEALRIAIEEARQRNGGSLPVAPRRLPNKPTR
ncbi:hypothetical protein GCM10011374_34250 [Kocuria dechangensis]|uniref:Uncharacterized protein n=1 Tax=Kocuria dechangensis TaxID=1176249 RepID=A0A917LYH8_9MICC|nr:hypothetical protein GCM10011374_34250 [Kocuria dechangensis]